MTQKKPHDEKAALTPSMQLRAETAFGAPEAAHGLVDWLISEFGKAAAKVILDWLLKKQAAEPAPQHALLSADTLRHWAAALLRLHQAEVEALITAEVHTIVTAGIDALDAPSQ